MSIARNTGPVKRVKVRAEVELSEHSETIWLHVKTASGSRAAINLGASPIRHKFLTEWAEEQLKNAQ